MDEKRTTLIYDRNQLIAKLTWVFFTITVLTNALVDPLILVYIIPAGLLTCLVMTRVARKDRVTENSMYVAVLTLFLFFFFLIQIEPILLNFIFIWFALLLSSIYHQDRPILLAGFLTVACTIYFFSFYQEQIFPNSDPVDVIYFSLFGLFFTVFLIYSSRFTERLRERAEQKEAKTSDQLWETREYLESFFNHMTDAVVVHDRHGMIMKVNKRFEGMYGWKEDEIVGQRVPFIKEESVDEIYRLWSRLDSGQSDYEMSHHTKTGELIDVSMTISPIRNKSGEVVALATIAKDYTERKKTEELLRRSEKLSVVGQLAAGVAHEIRNPLTVVSGFIQLLQQNQKMSPEHFEMIDSELKRVNTIIGEFLLLAKPNDVKFEYKSILPLVEEVVTLLNTTAVMQNIKIFLSYDERVPHIKCEPNQIKQVIINLLKNAIEAMKFGGSIYVYVGSYHDDYVRIRVVDQGEGIPDDKMTKLGEPFYTTKDKGTGLGLMVSHKIIENHHGQLRFVSKPNEGTSVDLLLPKSTHVSTTDEVQISK
ncbi:ATP-binding protein [Desertibacillus haloalkaliphilus]|uniref:ATP-binding protein n=1 Tax=Desertibacillus haloalkaliphilus TaxID=1328930 RepID=UPI001C27A60D|nr:ATP-binding protein [Desertibacillus haloalkaliphilus]MBU8905823.1 PAS domain S-box protein [Desertibacillus haloalkaliphilus]